MHVYRSDGEAPSASRLRAARVLLTFTLRARGPITHLLRLRFLDNTQQNSVYKTSQRRQKNRSAPLTSSLWNALVLTRSIVALARRRWSTVLRLVTRHHSCEVRNIQNKVQKKFKKVQEKIKFESKPSFIARVDIVSPGLHLKTIQCQHHSGLFVQYCQ